MSAIAKSSQAFRTIAEAAEELDVPAHVLRFWEGKFTQLRPLKRAGGRRHYRPDDMALLRGIRALLQEDGYQLKGVQKLLRDEGIGWVRERGLGATTQDDGPAMQVSLAKKSAPEPTIVNATSVRAPNPESGPLFEAAKPRSEPQSVSPAAGIILRQALVKLEKARGLLVAASRSAA
jgi:DNA-binding transcriptional MerR regulator